MTRCAPERTGRPMPPPMRVEHKGWLRHRDLSHAEAEAYWLREAAKYAGSPLVAHQVAQQIALAEADRNRMWGRRSTALMGAADG